MCALYYFKATLITSFGHAVFIKIVVGLYIYGEGLSWNIYRVHQKVGVILYLIPIVCNEFLE